MIIKALIKEYQIEDGVFVLHHVLETLFQKYCCCIPKNIERKMLELINDTDFKDDISDRFDIEKDTIIRKVVYKKRNFEQQKKS